MSSFTQVNGILRVVFATTAFAMGLDAPNIHYIIHWKPPKCIEDYVQESGRGGRDGKPAVALLYCRESKNLSPDMINYIRNTAVCHRKLLLSSFGDYTHTIRQSPLHLCCDICAQKCYCGDCVDLTAPILSSDTPCTNSNPPANIAPSVPDVLKETIRQEIEKY